MDKKERKSIKRELKEIEDMNDNAEEMAAQLDEMCTDIGNVGSMFEDVPQRDIDFLLSELDHVADAYRVQQDMMDDIFVYYNPLGYWEDSSLEDLSMSEFRTFYRDVTKKYKKFIAMYYDFYDTYNVLVHEKFVRAKPKIRSVL